MLFRSPQVLDCDIVRFQNNKEKWIAFIGKIEDRPYEIFTGLADDEDGILLPRWVNDGFIIKNRDEKGNSRYDFQYVNQRGYKTTIRSEEHTSELQSRPHLVCRLLLEKKKK